MPRPLKASSKAWWNVRLLSGVVYGVLMGVIFSLVARNWLLGFPLGLLAGVVFGFVFAMAARWFSDRQIDRCQAKTPDLRPNETIQLEGPANLFSSKEDVGGYLWLTNSRLLFRSHRIKDPSEPWEVALSTITSVEAGNTLGLLQNRLHITLTDGKTVRFVVNKNDFWADAIDAAVALAPAK